MFHKIWPFAIWAVVAASQTHADDSLTFVRSLSLYLPEVGLKEPSGLSFGASEDGFWIVDDQTKAVFWLDEGGELQRMHEDPRLSDLEGVALDADRRRLILVSEDRASLFQVQLNPPYHISEHPLAQMASSDGLYDALADRRNGLEGVTVDPASGAVFVIKERHPKLLIELSPDLSQILSIDNLDKGVFSKRSKKQDISGVVADGMRGGFWVVSDTGEHVDFLTRDLADARRFDLYWTSADKRRHLQNAEGVALSTDGAFLFVLTDDGRDSKLVQYEIGPGL